MAFNIENAEVVNELEQVPTGRFNINNAFEVNAQEGRVNPPDDSIESQAKRLGGFFGLQGGTPEQQFFSPERKALAREQAGQIIEPITETAVNIAASIPFFRAAKAIPFLGKIPALRAAVGLGSFEATKKALTGEPEEALEAGVTGVASGLILGGAQKLGASVIPGKIPGAERIGSALGAGGLGFLLGQEEDKPVSSAIFLGTLGAVFPSTRLFKGAAASIHRATKGQLVFAEKVRKHIFEARINEGRKFGASLKNISDANPNKTGSISLNYEEIKILMEENPTFKSVVNRSPKFKAILNDPSKGEKLTVGKIQDIINQLNEKIPKAAREGKSVRPSDRDALNLVSEIKLNQSDSFVEMLGVRKGFAEKVNAFNLIKGKVRKGALLKSLASEFGDPELNAEANKLLSEDLKKEITSFRKVRNIIDTFKNLGRRSVEGAAVGAGARSILGGGR